MLKKAAEFFKDLRKQMSELRTQVHERIKQSAALK